MSETGKLNAIAVLLEKWRADKDKFGEIVDRMPTDLSITQYAVFSEHVSELEKILYG